MDSDQLHSLVGQTISHYEILEKLGEGGKHSQCGWLDDKFGITWQIVPDALGRHGSAGHGDECRERGRIVNGQVGEHLDYFALGHFHQLNAVKGVFMNGSVKGPDEYVLKQFGSADPWEQMLLTFDKQACRLTDISFINGE